VSTSRDISPPFSAVTKLSTCVSLIVFDSSVILGYTVVYLVEPLRYNPEGREFDS
jgi:hypothetical protein